MILAAIGWVCLTPILLVSTVFAVETGLGLWPLRSRHVAPRHPRIAVIVPAYDEEAGIAATVSALRADLPPGGRLLVVADNCSDATATQAWHAGAEAIERHDPGARGKGHALAFARDHLAADPPDVAIVIDADCRISAGGVSRLSDVALGYGAPIQAAYLLKPRLDAGPMVQLSGFAFLVKNLIRQRGLARIGAPALLTGSGMALPWTIFAAAPLATDDIVEDLALGIALARASHPPRFCADVLIESEPSSMAGTIEQRRRWEHGFLATARSQALPLLISGQRDLTWLGLHLLVPPVALLMAMNVLLLMLLTGIALSGGPRTPLLITTVLLAINVLLVAGAWLSRGRDQVQAATLLRAPLYILWKLPIYLTSFTRYFLDEKAVVGLSYYAGSWPGRLRAIFREGPRSDISFGKDYAADSLPFSVELLPAGSDFDLSLLADAALVSASGDNYRHFPLARLCEERSIPLVYTIENIVETRLRILALENRNRFSKLKTAVWTLLSERKRRRAFRRAAGLQANGVPAAQAYRSSTIDVLTYFDTRLPLGLIATDEEINRKTAQIMSGAPLRLGFSGRLEPMKGIDHLIKVAQALKAGNMSFSLDIFGSGSLESLIRQRIKTLGLDGMVTVHPALDFTTGLVPRFKETIDLFLCCHRQADPSCTYLEAMGCGVAMFGYGNKALKGLLGLAPIGQWVREGSPSTLARALIEIDGNRQQLSAMMHEARNLSRANSFETTFQKRIEHFIRLAKIQG
ncbi:MAG: glycosyltransferase [Sphingomonas sp.]|nr:glycosyltransferase [Sphingomonas sp.]